MSTFRYNDDITLRAATADDVPTIYAMIWELADYEKLNHEVVGTEAMLYDSLFGEKPVIEAVMADYQGETVGYALFFHNFSTFLCRKGIYLEDLYVRQTMRGHGVGKALFTYLGRLAKERRCGRLEWSVLNWNQPSIDFYKAQGAMPVDGWTIYRLTGEALERLADSTE